MQRKSGEHTPLECWFRRLAETGFFVREILGGGAHLKKFVEAGRLNQHPGRDALPKIPVHRAI